MITLSYHFDKLSVNASENSAQAKTPIKKHPAFLKKDGAGKTK